jgi:hypothetical protein
LEWFLTLSTWLPSATTADFSPKFQPEDISPGSYRLMIIVTEPSNLSSEPFSTTIFAAR